MVVFMLFSGFGGGVLSAVMAGHAGAGWGVMLLAYTLGGALALTLGLLTGLALSARPEPPRQPVPIHRAGTQKART